MNSKPERYWQKIQAERFRENTMPPKDVAWILPVGGMWYAYVAGWPDPVADAEMVGPFADRDLARNAMENRVEYPSGGVWRGREAETRRAIEESDKAMDRLQKDFNRRMKAIKTRAGK